MAEKQSKRQVMSQLLRRRPAASPSALPPEAPLRPPTRSLAAGPLQLNNLAWSTDDPKALCPPPPNPTLSALFKRYVNVLLENGEYFFADSEMSKDLATSLLQDQIKVTEELYQKIQAISEAEFKQFLHFADLRPTATASANVLSHNNCEVDEKRVPSFAKSFGSLGHNLSLLGLSANHCELFEFGEAGRAQRPSPGLGVGWPGGFTSIPRSQASQTPQQQSRNESGKLVLASANQFCDFQSALSKN